MRVYDTRLDPEWLKRTVRDMCPTAPGKVVYVCGDLLTEPRPVLDDVAALSRQQLERWGPSTLSYYLDRTKLNGSPAGASSCRSRPRAR